MFPEVCGTVFRPFPALAMFACAYPRHIPRKSSRTQRTLIVAVAAFFFPTENPKKDEMKDSAASLSSSVSEPRSVCEELGLMAEVNLPDYTNQGL
jgi:hypothetical protein